MQERRHYIGPLDQNGRYFREGILDKQCVRYYHNIYHEGLRKITKYLSNRPQDTGPPEYETGVFIAASGRFLLSEKIVRD
jgi:hypothetical protein